MEQMWFNKNPKDIPYEIPCDKYQSLVDMFEKVVRKNPDSPAFINMGKVLTYRRLEERSRHLAAYFQNELKLQKNDRVAIMMPNLLQYPICLFAILRAGLIVVNVNPLYTPRELEKQLKDSGATAIIVADNFAATLEKVVATTDIQHIIVTKLGDQLSRIKRTFVNFYIQYIMKYIPKYKLSNGVLFKEALKIGRESQYLKPDIDRNDIAFLQYTGGTTGTAKGAILTHNNLLSNIAQTKLWVSPILDKLKDPTTDSSLDNIVVSPLPLYHVFALMICGLLVFELGLKNLLITNPKNLNRFIKELKKHPPSVIIGINTLYNSLLNHEAIDDVDFSKLKLTIAGGMPTNPAIANKWFEKTNCLIFEGYGMTECSPLIAAPHPNFTQHDGSIGFPIPSTKVKLLDDDNNEVGVDMPGELWIKGPQVMKGYWNNQQETDNVLKDGWLATGDIAIMDNTGKLRIVDRKKDLIIVSGFNVYPTEIENVLANNPKILEVAVIGIPHEINGESIKIFVVKKDPSLTREELKLYCRKYLTGYKIPRFIEFRDSLPKSNVGKILHRELRAKEIDNIKIARDKDC